jgi:hypothetical protein
MRRFVVSIALALTGIVFVGTQPAFALTRTVEEIRPIVGTVDGICGFPVIVEQRDVRTLVSWSHRGSIVLQTVRTQTQTFFTNRAQGVVLDNMPEHYAITTTPGPGGAGTILFVGRGAVWGTDTSLGRPFFLWVTGVVAMQGVYDYKTGSLTVSSKRVFGESTDLCESLVTGLKPRH